MKTRAILLILSFFLLSKSFAQWTPFCQGNSNGTIIDLAYYQDTLFATGLFSRICGQDIPNIAKWNGDEWETVGTGIPDNGHSITIIDDQLYLAKYEPDVDSNWVYNWNGQHWSTLGTGIYLTSAMPGFSNTPSIYDILEYNGNIIACGEFDRVGTEPISGIMSWDGNNWQALGEGLEGNINNTAPVMFPHQLMIFDGKLLVSGNFRQAGSQTVNGIAQWDGENWEALGEGFNNTVYAIGEFEGELYAGGAFTQSGSTNLNRIAKWNGTNWESVGFGFSSSGANDFTFVHTLKVIDEKFYIAGGFDEVIPDTASALACGSIIEFDGTNISTLNGGSTFDIEAITTYNDQLLIGGGTFNQGYIALLDPSTSLNSLEPALDIKVFPNPTQQFLQIEGLESSQDYNIQVFDLVGRKRLDQSIVAPFKIDLKGFNNGLYILQINGFQQQWVQKIEVIRQ